MNFGKVSENVYNRTIYKTIHTTGYFDKETKNEIWSGYMNTSREILTELKCLVQSS